MQVSAILEPELSREVVGFAFRMSRSFLQTSLAARFIVLTRVEVFALHDFVKCPVPM